MTLIDYSGKNRKQTSERKKEDVVVAESQTMDGTSQRSGTSVYREG